MSTLGKLVIAGATLTLIGLGVLTRFADSASTPAVDHFTAAPATAPAVAREPPRAAGQPRLDRPATAGSPTAPPAIGSTGPTPEPTTPSRAKEMALREHVLSSARSSEPWTAHARAVLAAVPVERGSVGDIDCRTEGCVVTIEYVDELAFELGDEAITGSQAFRDYTGWRHRGWQREESGRVVATWFFLRPEAGATR